MEHTVSYDIKRSSFLSDIFSVFIRNFLSATSIFAWRFCPYSFIEIFLPAKPSSSQGGLRYSVQPLAGLGSASLCLEVLSIQFLGGLNLQR